MRILLWAVLSATVALYLLMILWSLPQIIQEADGLLPFDLRPFGYTAEEARNFLNALSEEGRAFYLDTQLMLDTVYPALLALSLILLVRAVIRGLALRLILSLVALVGMGADYIENMHVEALLTDTAVELGTGAVANASLWTMVKSGCSAAVMVAVLIGAIGVAVRRWMPR